MADQLKEGGFEIAAMESTASYWKPLYNILECCGLQAMVVNIRLEKEAADAIQNILRIGNTRAQAIVAAIATDMD